MYKTILQNIFLKNNLHFNDETRLFDIDEIKKNLYIESDILSILLQEELFLGFFTKSINDVIFIDLKLIENIVNSLNDNNHIFDTNIDVIQNLISDPNFCCNQSATINNKQIIDINNFLTLQNIKEIEKEKENNKKISLKSYFLKSSKSKLLKNIDPKSNSQDYHNILQADNEDIQKTINLKNKIKKIQYENKIKTINLLKVYSFYPILKKYLPNVEYITAENFCTIFLNTIFIKDKTYENFIYNLQDLVDNIKQFVFIDNQHIPLKDLDILLNEDLHNFIDIYLSHSNQKLKYIFTNRLGINTNTLNLQQMADNLLLSRQRIEQIIKKINIEYSINSRFCLNTLEKIIENEIENGIDLQEIFKITSKNFSTEKGFLIFIETILKKRFNTMQNIINYNIGSKIFENYFSNNLSPFSYNEIFEIIKPNVNDAQYIGQYINNLIKNELLKMENGKFTPQKMSISALFSQTLLLKENGDTVENILETIENKFGKKFGRISIDQHRFKWIYLYGASTYRHVNYFHSQYNENLIQFILNNTYEYLETEKSTKNIYQCLNYLEQNNIYLNYYDFRYIIKKYGTKYTQPIYLDGKSNADRVSLNKNLK